MVRHLETNNQQDCHRYYLFTLRTVPLHFVLMRVSSAFCMWREFCRLFPLKVITVLLMVIENVIMIVKTTTIITIIGVILAIIIIMRLIITIIQRFSSTMLLKVTWFLTVNTVYTWTCRHIYLFSQQSVMPTLTI